MTTTISAQGSYELGLQQLKDEIAARDREIERLRGLSPDNMPKSESEWWIALKDQNREIERLRAALQALHDWYVEYARINNLFNDDGTPATFHELLEARRALEHKP